MSIVSHARRLFIGDLHGCLEELNELLDRFGFQPGRDKLFSVGDVVGKGPDVRGTLKRLKDSGAQVVMGNHDHFLVQTSRKMKAGKHLKNQEYLDSLGAERDEWVDWVSTWPAYLELPDIILVHAGLVPGKRDLAEMDPELLMRIRTWDGKGEHLNREDNPPWFECVRTEKTVVFGHWAKRGLVDLPNFKGLDTGCVYGGRLTGWCPEENRFLHVDAKRAYVPIHSP